MPPRASCRGPRDDRGGAARGGPRGHLSAGAHQRGAGRRPRRDRVRRRAARGVAPRAVPARQAAVDPMGNRRRPHGRGHGPRDGRRHRACRPLLPDRRRRPRVRRDPARRPVAPRRRAVGRAHRRGTGRVPGRRRRRPARPDRAHGRRPRSGRRPGTPCSVPRRLPARGGRLMIPDVVLTVAFAWATLLLLAGGLLLLRAREALTRLLALDVLSTIVIILLAVLSYLDDASYFIDAALAVALLSFSATMVAGRYLIGRRPER